MRHTDLKIGMLVRANEFSNDEYTITTEVSECVGRVTAIGEKYFKLVITESADKEYIGCAYDVEARYFDIVGENTGMKVELKTVEVEKEFGYGDLLVFEEGKQVLVISDTDGTDYRGIILGEYKPTKYDDNKSSFVKMLEKEYELGSLVRVVKVENLKLSEI